MKAVKDHNPKIGACLDTGHLINAALAGKNLDPAAEVRVMGARNYGLHLKDNDNRTDENVVFGKGPLDVVGVLRALKEVGFKGCISIEYEANPKDPTADLTACLDYLREAVKKV
jgi:inosose dehydratase